MVHIFGRQIDFFPSFVFCKKNEKSCFLFKSLDSFFMPLEACEFNDFSLLLKRNESLLAKFLRLNLKQIYPIPIDMLLLLALNKSSLLFLLIIDATKAVN